MTNAEVSDDELAGLDEFGLLHENAEQIGVDAIPPGARVESARSSGVPIRHRSCSCTVAVRTPYLDTVIVGLVLAALAVDLPGAWPVGGREDGGYGPRLNAETLRPVQRECAPLSRLVVGIPPGGLTALWLAAAEPELVPEKTLTT